MDKLSAAIDRYERAARPRMPLRARVAFGVLNLIAAAVDGVSLVARLLRR